MKSKNLLRALAYSFISYMIEKIELENIDRIILFGSVARGDASQDSDIDIFIDTKNKGLKKEIDEILANFYKSFIYKDYWKLVGVENDIKCIVDTLNNWKLKRSIISEGITLFDKTVEKINGKYYSLIKISVKGGANRKLRLWRMIYGYKQKIGKKHYYSEGLINKCGGKKISSGVFIIPLSKSQFILNMLKKEKISHSIIEFCSDMV